jgi:hypothetical protein
VTQTVPELLTTMPRIWQRGVLPTTSDSKSNPTNNLSGPCQYQIQIILDGNRTNRVDHF